ncbi:MAG: hypothetical protein R3B99_15125 [Polyangiales bacterium]
MFAFVRASLLGSLLVLVGCVHPLARRFEADTGCPAGDTERQPLGAGLWEVRGCERAIRYVCGAGACVRDSERDAPTPRPTEASAATPPTLVNGRPPEGVSEGSAADGTRGVRLTLYGGSASVALVMIVVPSVDPNAVHLRALDINGRPIERCSGVEIRTTSGSSSVSMPPGTLSASALRQAGRAIVGFTLCGRQLRMSDDSHEKLETFFATIDRVLGEGDDAPSTDRRDAVVRERLTARAGAILACVGADSTAVRARWSEAGVVSVSVANDDAQVEACVRAAVGALRVEAGEAGELLHPVSR